MGSLTNRERLGSVRGSRLATPTAAVRRLARDTGRVGAYTPDVTPTSRPVNSRAAATPVPQKRRRRPPNWPEQMKREAWGRFWGNANKGAMKR